MLGQPLTIPEWVGSRPDVFADLLPSGLGMRILKSYWCCFQLPKIVLLGFNWRLFASCESASVAWATAPSDFGMAAEFCRCIGNLLAASRGCLLSSDETGSGYIGRLRDDPV
ncbi:hypothetical protein Nepgr_023913 [Nepenthes gracilis]|uniref:Uncharacterized protein n=1 Tax=Nepenthes gracilis TaxID=150966 RepID=A0AAD3T284_NEPGR|nr:hypothetical protein Nepgr_023913 [Nepenthes gracilis]